MESELESRYEIGGSVEFIISGNYTKVALQFPDDLLNDSVSVLAALRLHLRRRAAAPHVSLFLLADTAYGTCCVDELAASHVSAHCLLHYGHACLSPTSKLPIFFVFPKSWTSVPHCVQYLTDQATAAAKPLLVLFGLEYAHLIHNIRQEVAKCKPQLEVLFSEIQKRGQTSTSPPANTRNIGGLGWQLKEGRQMEDYLLFWIGSDDSAFANVVLTFNGCEIVRYDASENKMVTDFSQQRRILKRRYYLVEKAKDANIVGILVGTLGIAGYVHMINQIKELIEAAGKKSYTLVMGRPNPSKLANFPECDIFIYVSCAQTALLDSKEYLAPVITPFEAMLAFSRNSQWTGQYVMEFGDLIDSPIAKSSNHTNEPRFSFLQGGYVEDTDAQVNNEEEVGLALANATEKALQLRENANLLAKRTVKSGAEFLSTRSYQGLEINEGNSLAEPYLSGRSGRAAGYRDEKGSKVGVTD